MALTNDERQLAKALKASGKSTTEVARIIATRRAGATVEPEAEEEAPAPSFGERVATDINDAGKRVSDAISGQGEFAGRSPIRRGTEAAASAAGGVMKVASEVLPAPVRTGLEKVGEFAGNVVNFIGQKIGNIPAVQNWVSQHPQAAQALEEVAGTAAAGGKIAGTILTAKGVSTAASKGASAVKAGATKAVNEVRDAVTEARPMTKALYERSTEIVKPTPTPQKALGEVLQSKKPLTSKDVEAFKNIDTEGISTYAQLEKRVNDSIGKMSQQVDDVLAQDPTPIPMANLVTRTTSGSGRVIERNFVQIALDHLKELYAKTADDAGAADIDDLIAKANESGLTRLEVNDISRLYNSEFGSKAFNKIGDPITTVNAQAYENIRTGLKDVARAGMGGAEAQAADKIISSLYNVKKLVGDNRAAVQKLQQKISERGLLEKVGHGLAKYSDILMGGSLRGFVGGLLPRGAGYKVMNALDLEERLARNLEIIRKAIEAGSDDAIIQATKKLEASVTPPTQ